MNLVGIKVDIYQLSHHRRIHSYSNVAIVMFQEKGYIHLPSILSSNSVQQFQAQIIEELSTEGQQEQERCVGKVTLNDPTKGQRKGQEELSNVHPKELANNGTNYEKD